MPPLLLRILYALALAAVAVPGLDRLRAAEVCTTSPRSGWISWLEVQDLLRENGMRLVQVRIGSTQCLDVTGLDAHGQHHILVIHPMTGRILSRMLAEDQRPRVPWRAAPKPG